MLWAGDPTERCSVKERRFQRSTELSPGQQYMVSGYFSLWSTTNALAGAGHAIYWWRHRQALSPLSQRILTEEKLMCSCRSRIIYNFESKNKRKNDYSIYYISMSVVVIIFFPCSIVFSLLRVVIEKWVFLPISCHKRLVSSNGSSPIL